MIVYTTPPASLLYVFCDIAVTKSIECSLNFIVQNQNRLWLLVTATNKQLIPSEGLHPTTPPA